MIDFVGEGDAIAKGLAMTANDGYYYIVGYGGKIDIPTIDMITSEKTIVGNLVGTYAELVELMALADRGLMALAGLCFRPRYWPWMLLYFVMRSAMLSTIEAPEARYTLECFPMVFALGGVGIYGAYKGIATALRSRANFTFL